MSLRWVIANYCHCLIVFVVSVFWECLIYQMKAGSFRNRLISNTYIYDVRSYCYSTIIYSTLISLTVFLAVKKCAFVSLHGGSAVTFFTNRNFIFIENMYASVIRQAENDFDAGLHFYWASFMTS